VKLKELFYLMGLKPRPRRYGYVVETHDLAGEGRIEVAQWQHEAAYRVAPSQAAVDQWRALLRPGDVAIDIGAHTGDSTLPIALAVGVNGVVLALEPNPNVFAVLAKNAELNPLKMKIIPLNFAAMRTDGKVEFQYGEAGFNNGGFHEGMTRWQHGSAYSLEVEGRNLQQLLERDYADLIPRIRLVKVDAEGFDLAILETIDKLIRQQQPLLHVEMFDLKKSDPGARVRLFEFLTGHGYQVHRVESEEQLFGEIVTAEKLMSWRGYDVICVGAPGGASQRKTAGSP
jgi:FkbM family methyltransferase